jgi:1-aminocyclopropane-1-carboxylate synthase 1/2/6
VRAASCPPPVPSWALLVLKSPTQPFAALKDVLYPIPHPGVHEQRHAAPPRRSFGPEVEPTAEEVSGCDMGGGPSVDATSSRSLGARDGDSARLLSVRGRRLASPPPAAASAPSASTYGDVVRAAWQNSYDATANPGGWVNLGVAENKVSSDLVVAALAAAPRPRIADIGYTAMHGDERFRAALSRLLSDSVVRRPVSAEHLVVAAGASSVMDHLACALCDAGDFVMAPTPLYPGILRNFRTRAGVLVHFAPTDPRLGFAVTADCLQHSWEGADSARRASIKAVLITNPANPTGRVCGAPEIGRILAWCRERHLHLIFDEVYALSSHAAGGEGEGDVDSASAAPPARFTSVAEVLGGDLPPWCHVVYGLGKDFCLAGLRVGVLYSQNAALLRASAKCAYLSATSTTTQRSLTCLLDGDSGFVPTFIRENSDRLARSKRVLVDQLDGLGIPHIPAQAGFFLWVDMRRFLDDTSSSAEQAEVELSRQLATCRVVLAPGAEYRCSQPGWFRVCFAAVPVDVLRFAWTSRVAPVLRSILQAKEARSAPPSRTARCE